MVGRWRINQPDLQSMSEKILKELVITVAIMAAVWFGLLQIDWVKVLKIQQKTQSTEEKIGDLFWDVMKHSDTEITAKSVIGPIDSMLEKICTSNSIDPKKIKLHLLRKDEINAFAIPNNHLVVYSGLINACESEEELCGVIGHELAHIEKKHVMNKLVKEIGLSVLISISGGNGSAETIKSMIKLLSSSAYDRSLETEADLTAVDYLINAGIDPEPMANFMYRLSDQTKNIPKQLFWISTHPESKERAEEMVEHIAQRGSFETFPSDSIRFEKLKGLLKE